MSIESFVRKTINEGRVHRGAVSEVGLTMEVVRLETKHGGFLDITKEVRTEVPAFKVQLPDGSTRLLQATDESSVEVGENIEFGEHYAMWSKVG